ncbi:uncharacterized protein LTR77_005816 [Saxophila tyrrhenica]|uniref:Uncharacterized protein n=1 Tax=Saxophila tyrrhenica TaxID=1690608 RepID=A0AAV9P9L5_9PEZI|nr:hypothetical protein LTR77_005816 [Saxophila tyrrhenica]
MYQSHQRYPSTATDEDDFEQQERAAAIAEMQMFCRHLREAIVNPGRLRAGDVSDLQDLGHALWGPRQTQTTRKTTQDRLLCTMRAPVAQAVREFGPMDNLAGLPPVYPTNWHLALIRSTSSLIVTGNVCMNKLCWLMPKATRRVHHMIQDSAEPPRKAQLMTSSS